MTQIGKIIPIDIGTRSKVVIWWEEVGEKSKNKAWGGKMVLDTGIEIYRVRPSPLMRS